MRTDRHAATSPSHLLSYELQLGESIAIWNERNVLHRVLCLCSQSSFLFKNAEEIAYNTTFEIIIPTFVCTITFITFFPKIY